MDDPRLAELGKYTPEGILTPGYGDTYLFSVGRDDVHGILHYLIPQEKREFLLGMFGYDDDELNADILKLMEDPNVRVQVNLDKSQAGGVHERKILALDIVSNPDFYNFVSVMQSATHQINHTKAGVLGSLGMAFESSTNWSNSGEGTGINLKVDVSKPQKGYVAQNNTFVVSVNPIFISRLGSRLTTEHLIGQLQQKNQVTIK